MLPLFTTYLIDLDGVVYRGEEIVPGAHEFIDWLNTNQKKYLFLTNNSFASESQVLTKLARLGITVSSSHVLGAGQAAVQNIARRFPGGNVYVVGEQPLLALVRPRSRLWRDGGGDRSGQQHTSRGGGQTTADTPAGGYAPARQQTGRERDDRR